MRRTTFYLAGKPNRKEYRARGILKLTQAGIDALQDLDYPSDRLVSVTGPSMERKMAEWWDENNVILSPVWNWHQWGARIRAGAKWIWTEVRSYPRVRCAFCKNLRPRFLKDNEPCARCLEAIDTSSQPSEL
jgi:hypothetical protein